jgi:hypothetical protein
MPVEQYWGQTDAAVLDAVGGIRGQIVSPAKR